MYNPIKEYTRMVPFSEMRTLDTGGGYFQLQANKKYKNDQAKRKAKKIEKKKYTKPTTHY